MQAPADIFRVVGERLTQALISGDFDLYAQVMDLPLRIEPRAGEPYEMKDTAELQTDFDLYHDHIKLHRVTDIHREIQQIDTPDEDHITATVKMNILSDANRVVDPFFSVMHLHRTAQGWRFFLIQSPLGHINWTLGKGRIEDGSFT